MSCTWVWDREETPFSGSCPYSATDDDDRWNLSSLLGIRLFLLLFIHSDPFQGPPPLWQHSSQWGQEIVAVLWGHYLFSFFTYRLVSFCQMISRCWFQGPRVIVNWKERKNERVLRKSRGTLADWKREKNVTKIIHAPVHTHANCTLTPAGISRIKGFSLWWEKKKREALLLL